MKTNPDGTQKIELVNQECRQFSLNLWNVAIFPKFKKLE